MSPVHTAKEIETNSKPGDATVLVCQSEHKTCLLLDCWPPPMCPETSIWLTEVDHIPGQWIVIMVRVGIPGQQLGTVVTMMIVTHYTEIVH